METNKQRLATKRVAATDTATATAMYRVLDTAAAGGTAVLVGVSSVDGASTDCCEWCVGVTYINVNAVGSTYRERREEVIDRDAESCEFVEVLAVVGSGSEEPKLLTAVGEV